MLRGKETRNYCSRSYGSEDEDLRNILLMFLNDEGLGEQDVLVWTSILTIPFLPGLPV
jgi:hypothetical protein